MSAATPAVERAPRSAQVRRVFREQPVIPLIGLLVILVAVLLAVQPGILNRPFGWANGIVYFAVPLAILAASQTLTMLTGGIDLSVATTASMAAYVMATQAPSQGDATAIVIALVLAALVGLMNGIGVGIFRVQPLIMTLATGLVVLGGANVYQKLVITAGSRVPEPVATIGSGTSFGFFPNTLFVFIPIALLIMLILKRTGYGRMLYAVGDNAVAARLAGVRVWQVLLVLYVLSGLLAGVGGIILAGAAKTATLNAADAYLLPSIAAAEIGRAHV